MNTTNKPGVGRILRVTARMLHWGIRTNPYTMPLLLILLIASALIPFVSSYFDSRVIDQIVHLVGLPTDQRDLSPLTSIIGAVIALLLIERVLWVCIAYIEKLNYFHISRDISMQFLGKASDLDMYHYENAASHDVIQKAKDTYTWKPAQFLSRTLNMSADAIRILSSMIIILSFSAPAFVLVLVTTVPALITSIKLGHGSWSIWGTNATDRRRFVMSSDLLMRERSLMELRIFNSKDYLLETVQGIYDVFTTRERKDQLRRTLIDSAMSNLALVGTTGFWIMAIMAVLRGDISIGLFTFYVGSLQRFSGSLNGLFRNLSAHYEDGLYLADLFTFFDLKNNIVSGTETLPASDLAPRIEFRDVCFAYPGTERLVLNHFNLTIEPGEHVALIGINGAGKSTLIKLLCRFYDVTSGQILINGVDIRDLNIQDYYQHIGILFQDFVRYGQFDVRTNIELGNAEKRGDGELLTTAIYKGDAGVFINQFEHGLDQVLDKSFEGGINPSDGQWQRIALARAFFRNAPILMLDEPTSAIDAKAEAEIFERLYEFSEGKSLVIVSHRFSTVRQADRIVVLDGGRIIESGTHDDLMLLNGKYREAFEAQAKGYQETAQPELAPYGTFLPSHLNPLMQP